MRTLSPLRKLVQAYSEDLISKDEYENIRTLLLDKLEQKGVIKDIDLDNFYSIKKVSPNSSINANYSISDIIITILGLSAAAALAYILYS